MCFVCNFKIDLRSCGSSEEFALGEDVWGKFREKIPSSRAKEAVGKGLLKL
jgi:hypothetical protein